MYHLPPYLLLTTTTPFYLSTFPTHSPVPHTQPHSYTLKHTILISSYSSHPSTNKHTIYQRWTSHLLTVTTLRNADVLMTENLAHSSCHARRNRLRRRRAQTSKKHLPRTGKRTMNVAPSLTSRCTTNLKRSSQHTQPSTQRLKTSGLELKHR
jgi:hypothetical protein